MPVLVLMMPCTSFFSIVRSEVAPPTPMPRASEPVEPPLLEMSDTMLSVTTTLALATLEVTLMPIAPNAPVPV